MINSLRILTNKDVTKIIPSKNINLIIILLIVQNTHLHEFMFVFIFVLLIIYLYLHDTFYTQTSAGLGLFHQLIIFYITMGIKSIRGWTAVCWWLVICVFISGSFLFRGRARWMLFLSFVLS